MQTSNRFFDDIAKVASGAASTLVGVKQEIEALARQQVERFVGEFDLVRRDEFEAAKAVAAKAREEQDRLEQRIAALEEKLQVLHQANPSPGGN
jgi:BMFP domain-containing protein YqiC